MRDLLPTLRILAAALALITARWGRRLLLGLGAGAALMAALAFTRLPFDAHRWLGTAAGECTAPPALIVVLGGSGMPSGPELLRLHRAAEAAQAWPDAAVCIIHPGAGPEIGAMAQELRLRGVEPARISLLREGDNTRAQALALRRRHPQEGLGVAVATAPENMLRSVLTFRRAGFDGACGLPAWDHAMPYGFAYDHRALGGKRWLPDVSARPGIRYTFWNYLKLEVTCLRECAALAYYRLNGWI